MKNNFFKGKEFYLFPPDETNTYKYEMMITNYGGKRVSNPNSKTDFLIAKNDKNIRVKNWIEITNKGENPYGEKDILNFLWLEDCVKQNKILPKHPMYMIYSTFETKEVFKRTLDKYSNSYTEPDTFDTLKYCIEQVKNQHTFFDLTNKDKKEIFQFFDIKDNSFFRNHTFWTKDPYLQLEIQLYGGEIKKDAEFVIKKKKKLDSWIEKREIK